MRQFLARLSKGKAICVICYYIPSYVFVVLVLKRLNCVNIPPLERKRRKEKVSDTGVLREPTTRRHDGESNNNKTTLSATAQTNEFCGSLTAFLTVIKIVYNNVCPGCCCCCCYKRGVIMNCVLKDFCCVRGPFSIVIQAHYNKNMSISMIGIRSAY